MDDRIWMRFGRSEGSRDEAGIVGFGDRYTAGNNFGSKFGGAPL